MSPWSSGLVGLALVLVTLIQACRHASAAFHPGHSPYVDWCIGIIFLTVVYNLDERTLMATQYLPWILYIVACAGLRSAAFRTAEDGNRADDCGGDCVSGTVLHFLTETDSFSDLHGAALQRWVANVLRFEEDRAVVACARADASWGLAHVRTVVLPGLWAYSKLKGRYRLPWSRATSDTAEDSSTRAGGA